MSEKEYEVSMSPTLVMTALSTVLGDNEEGKLVSEMNFTFRLHHIRHSTKHLQWTEHIQLLNTSNFRNTI